MKNSTRTIYRVHNYQLWLFKGFDSVLIPEAEKDPERLRLMSSLWTPHWLVFSCVTSGSATASWLPILSFNHASSSNFLVWFQLPVLELFSANQQHRNIPIHTHTHTFEVFILPVTCVLILPQRKRLCRSNETRSIMTSFANITEITLPIDNK